MNGDRVEGNESRQAVGPARDTHVLLLPLALVIGGPLLRRRHGSRRPAEQMESIRPEMGKEK